MYNLWLWKKPVVNNSQLITKFQLILSDFHEASTYCHYLSTISDNCGSLYQFTLFDRVLQYLDSHNTAHISPKYSEENPSSKYSKIAIYHVERKLYEIFWCTMQSTGSLHLLLSLISVLLRRIVRQNPMLYTIFLYVWAKELHACWLQI